MEPQKNLIPGNTVFYVLKNGEIRPLVLTRIDPRSPNVNGVVHFDGPNDAERLDAEIRSDLLRTGTLWLEDIPYSEKAVAGTWHLPPAMAAAART